MLFAPLLGTFHHLGGKIGVCDAVNLHRKGGGGDSYLVIECA